MDKEDAALIEEILREDAKINGYYYDDYDDGSGWQTVSYPRRQRKSSRKHEAGLAPGDNSGDFSRVVDEHAEKPHHRVVEAQRAVLEAAAFVGGSKEFFVEDYDDDDAGARESNAACPLKEQKAKKPKKTKISVSKAAAEIDVDDLAAFLIHISESYELQRDTQLMRFADYFGRAFAWVGPPQFPWMKMLRESTVTKMVDIPLSHVSEAVYKTSVEWLNRHSLDALGSFVLCLWEDIVSDLENHQGTVKGSKKVVQQGPSKSQVARFVVLAMTLRCKPDVLIVLLPILKDSLNCVGQDKLPVIVWAIAQACMGDLVVALYMWVRVLLPLLCEKSVNLQSRDLILQLVERIIYMPNSRQILLNGAVRKGERLVPPAALDVVMRLTCPSASARIKEIDRFKVVYPILKEVALAFSPGSKAMKQVAQQILSLVIKAAAEGNPELSDEASDVFIWCLTESLECYKLWEHLYLNNIGGSVAVLRKLFEEKKLQSPKDSTPLKATLNSFMQKNEKAMAGKDYADYRLSLIEADKYCKLLLSKSSKGGCGKALALSAVVAVTAAVLYNMQSEYFKQFLAEFNLQL